MTLPTPQKTHERATGGGTCMALELAWARFRKFWLRLLFPGYVQRMQTRRVGECPSCTHDIIDSRDLKYTRQRLRILFSSEDDRYAYATISASPATASRRCYSSR